MPKKFIHSLSQNIVKSFSGYYILWHILAISLTYVLVTSGFDWFYFKATRNALVDSIAMSAGFVGFFVPVLLPLGIHIWGKIKEKSENTMIAIGVAQAGLAGFLITVFYKAFTGRLPPEIGNLNPITDISNQFNFGFLRHGVFWGWPSSHTAVAFAMSFALITLYPNKKYVKYLAVLYAFFIGIGASIGFHWFSDFVAGTILGTLVGVIVGKSFLGLIKTSTK